MPFNLAELENTGWFFVKIAAIIGMALYVAFAFVVLKQVGIMNQTLDMNFERQLKMIARIHLVVAILVLAFSLVM